MPRTLIKRTSPDQSAAYDEISEKTGKDMAEIIDAAMTMYAASVGVEWPESLPRGGAHGVSVVPRGDLPEDEATIPLRVVSRVTRTGTQVLLAACASGWLKARKKLGKDRAQPYWFTSVEAINVWWHAIGKKKVWTAEDFNVE
jgi:hypothetical protein